MFKSLVSSLSLSPSAISQLAFYARRLKQEKISRLFSVLAAILVIGLQFATITVPPTASNAASPSDLIYGGIVSKSDLLSNYDGNAELRSIYTYLGISRADVAASTKATISSTDHSLNSLSRVAHSSTDKILTVDGKKYYYRPLYQADHGIASGSKYTVFEGKRSSDGGYFAVMFICGNIIFKTVPPHPTPTPPPPPKPVPGLACVDLIGDISRGEAPLKVTYTARASSSNQTIASYTYNFGDGITFTVNSAKVSHTYITAGTFKATLRVKGSLGTTTPLSDACAFTVQVTNRPAQIIQSKTALNLTQNVTAESKPAQAGDLIKYTLTTKNIGGTSINYVIEDDLTDILEYADVSDPGGGTVTNRIIAWPSLAIGPGATINKTFTIKVKSPIPSTPVGASDKYSFDLRMDNLYGNAVQVPLQPPVPKQIEEATSNLPATGAGATTVLVLIIAAFAFFFYLRNRQLMAEVKILRHDYQGGV